MKKGFRRVRVTIGANPNSASSVLTVAHAANDGMAKDPVLYATPVPPLSILMSQIKQVEVAAQLATSRAKGTAAARDAECRILYGMLETERSYVQTLCNACTTPEKAIAVAEGAGLGVARIATRNDPILGVTLGAQSGTVELDANAAALLGKTQKKTCFNWQFTTDGGKTFNNAPSTPHAKTTIANLTPLTMVGFRVNVTTTKGTGEWSQIVSILIQ